MTDFIIIGAGIAGLTASIYAIRAGHCVLVFEKGFYGGQIALTNEVENYPAVEKISGPDLSEKIYQQASSLGTPIRFEQVISVDLKDEIKKVVTTEDTYEAKTVLIANGVKRRKLGCPGEKEFAGRGVSYCATCDGAFFKGKTVAVVGGGNVALEDAIFLSNLCQQVYLIHRRDSFRGEKILVQTALSRKNIQILYHTTVEAIQGEATVSSLTIKNTQDKTTKSLSVNALFIAIGLEPDNSMFSDQLPMDGDGYLLADESCMTPLAGVYVAGDCRSKPLRQIITAASDGAVAAVAASHYLDLHFS